MTLYCLPGLGTDHRVFQQLQFAEHLRVQHLPWLPPLHNESLQQYAVRMGRQVNTSRPFALLGYSLGGMLATELHERLQPRHTILLSSVAGRHEFPPLLQMGRRLQVYRFMSTGFRIPFQYTPGWWMLGIQRAEDKRLLLQMMQHFSPAFTRWAVQAILTWERTVPPEGLIRIHGSNDRVFPLRYVQAQHTVAGGSHCMLFNQAHYISTLLRQVLT